jgi:DNA polymerase-1
MDVIKEKKPDHLAVAFDKGGSDLRNDLFPLTKQIVTLLEAIKIAVPYIQELLHAHSYNRSKRLTDDLIGIWY